MTDANKVGGGGGRGGRASFSAVISSMVPGRFLAAKTPSQQRLIASSSSSSSTGTARFDENNNNNDGVGGGEDENEDDDDEFYYDEFGFRVESDQKTNESGGGGGENTAHHHDNNELFFDIKLTTTTATTRTTTRPFAECSKHKLKWMAFLEFTLNADMISPKAKANNKNNSTTTTTTGGLFSWDHVVTLPRSDKLRGMVRGQGIPHSLRAFVWTRLCGALAAKRRAQERANSELAADSASSITAMVAASSHYSSNDMHASTERGKSKFVVYGDLFKNFEHDQYHTSKQIEKDLLRTLPTNASFAAQHSVGIPRLRRVLQSIAWLYPSIGYCQVISSLLSYRFVLFCFFFS
jgi:hypothetical protein